MCGLNGTKLFWNILVDPSQRGISNGSPSDRQKETLYYTIGGAAGTVVLILITLVVVLISYRRGVFRYVKLATEQMLVQYC